MGAAESGHRVRRRRDLKVYRDDHSPGMIFYLSELLTGISPHGFDNISCCS
jgi:hypothetical protein